MVDARVRAMRSNIRNYLYPMSLMDMMRVLDEAIRSGDKVRTGLINDYISEVSAEEGICEGCGDFAGGNGSLCNNCKDGM